MTTPDGVAAGQASDTTKRLFIVGNVITDFLGQLSLVAFHI
jgi:hypothetical protein